MFQVVTVAENVKVFGTFRSEKTGKIEKEFDQAQCESDAKARNEKAEEMGLKTQYQVVPFE